MLDDYYMNVMEFKIERAKQRYRRQRQFGRKTLLARDAKIKSRECLEEMCRQTGVTIEEVLGGTRYTPVVDVRTRWCVITRELLINHMSEVEIARWMEIPRVTMKVACDRWAAEQKIEREKWRQAQCPGLLRSTQSIEQSAEESSSLRPIGSGRH